MYSVCRSECDVCNPIKRKRRDTLEQVQQTEFYVAAGPFEIQELNEGLCLKISCVELSKG